MVGLRVLLVTHLLVSLVRLLVHRGVLEVGASWIALHHVVLELWLLVVELTKLLSLLLELTKLQDRVEVVALALESVLVELGVVLVRLVVVAVLRMERLGVLLVLVTVLHCVLYRNN